MSNLILRSRKLLACVLLYLFSAVLLTWRL